MVGKNDPLRSFGMRSSTSPAWVASSRGRAPLRSVLRDSVRSYRAAPIRSVASASHQVDAFAGAERLEQFGHGRLG
jgi:hypothetical protein